MTDRMYTLAEARTVIARQTCAIEGHDRDQYPKFGDEPYLLVCHRCGRRWRVTPIERATDD